MTFFCGCCMTHFDDLEGMTSNASLDRHLVAVHGIAVNKENGRATSKNFLKVEPKDNFKLNAG